MRGEDSLRTLFHGGLTPLLRGHHLTACSLLLRLLYSTRCSHPLSYRDQLFSSGRGPDQKGPDSLDASSRETSKTKASPPSHARVWRSGRDVFFSFGMLVLPLRQVAVMVVLLASPRA